MYIRLAPAGTSLPTRTPHSTTRCKLPRTAHLQAAAPHRLRRLLRLRRSCAPHTARFALRAPRWDGRNATLHARATPGRTTHRELDHATRYACHFAIGSAYMPDVTGRLRLTGVTGPLPSGSSLPDAAGLGVPHWTPATRIPRFLRWFPVPSGRSSSPSTGYLPRRHTAAGALPRTRTPRTTLPHTHLPPHCTFLHATTLPRAPRVPTATKITQRPTHTHTTVSLWLGSCGCLPACTHALRCLHVVAGTCTPTTLRCGTTLPLSRALPTDGRAFNCPAHMPARTLMVCPAPQGSCHTCLNCRSGG